jgi:ABC-2 type transport system ATP-binding protein
MVVEISGLTKVYPASPTPVRAVDSLDLAVEPGEIFGLLGPNGAGKTTTIGVCTTRIRPTSGSVSIAGTDVVHEPARARIRMGVVPQYNTLDRSLTLFENLYYHCRYFGFTRADASARARALLAQFQLAEREKAYPAQLSGGLQQRVLIARAIAHRPSVLFLDEPSAGLDPQSRIAMWEAVRALREEGITVVLTTHYMEEADSLCDRIAVVDHGKMLALDTPMRLKQTLGAGTVVDLRLRDIAGVAELASGLAALPGVASAQPTATGVQLTADRLEGLLASVVRLAEPFGLRDLRITEPSLETVFLRLTGRELRD